MQGHQAAHDVAREPSTPSPRRLAFSATVHCLTGCGIGEVLGLVIGSALGWHDLPSIALAVVLAFIFGYGLTLRPLLAGGLRLAEALRLAFAADTLSIAVMEIVDNAIILLIPGAMDAGLTSLLFWGSLAVALAVAFVVAFPVNLWLIRQGRGHAVVHGKHGGHGGHGGHGETVGHTGHDGQPHAH
ncbi:MAG TPA: DUF4396 domain-containing protein [Chloroflexia bacterium]|nr:DUF4396 domain-containing protein [Chloroflexia bacterium]